MDAWGWCTGTTQRDGMGREEGGGFRMGNTCIIFFKLKLNKKKINKNQHSKTKKKKKVCSLHLCLFCCLAYRVIITIFLNSIYMR